MNKKFEEKLKKLHFNHNFIKCESPLYDYFLFDELSKIDKQIKQMLREKTPSKEIFEFRFQAYNKYNKSLLNYIEANPSIVKRGRILTMVVCESCNILLKLYVPSEEDIFNYKCYFCSGEHEQELE